MGKIVSDEKANINTKKKSSSLVLVKSSNIFTSATFISLPKKEVLSFRTDLEVFPVLASKVQRIVHKNNLASIGLI